MHKDPTVGGLPRLYQTYPEAKRPC
jgi:hypothetical protein